MKRIFAALALIFSLLLTSCAVGNETEITIPDNGRDRVLIIGNSHILTSQIGDILQEMCGSKMIVDTVSVSNSTLSDHAQNEDTLELVRSETYTAVFLCGLYYPDCVDALGKFVDACSLSNTCAVLLPTHNESRKIIKAACEKYPSVPLIDWKAELDSLVLSGIHYSHFVIDDFGHSSPLAGFVGAQMIYRSLFSSSPDLSMLKCIPKEKLDILGNYIAAVH